MEGIDKPHAGKYKETTNDSNHDASCTLTSLPVWDLENFKRLIFVAQSVQSMLPGQSTSLFSQLRSFFQSWHVSSRCPCILKKPHLTKKTYFIPLNAKIYIQYHCRTLQTITVITAKNHILCPGAIPLPLISTCKQNIHPPLSTVTGVNDQQGRSKQGLTTFQCKRASSLNLNLDTVYFEMQDVLSCH
jgi:hypothetical protein